MNRRLLSRILAPAVVAGAVLAMACSEAGTGPGGIAAVSFDSLPSPGLVLGDTLRDALGNVAPLSAVAYDVDGVRHDEMPVNQTDFHHAQPIYEYFDGWWEDISGARTFEDLPANAQAYVKAVEAMSGARISAVGVGPSRAATVVIHELI